MIATNRKGQAFDVGEIVMMVDYPVLYAAMINQQLEIVNIKEWEACESGFMIKAKHKESGNEFTKWLDTNWFQKLKQ